jgi:hypothetical protein
LSRTLNAVRLNTRNGQSDHLSFAEVSAPDGTMRHAGVAVPLPYDREVLDMIVERVDRFQQIVSTPFLLENSVYFAAGWWYRWRSHSGFHPVPQPSQERIARSPNSRACSTELTNRNAD